MKQLLHDALKGQRTALAWKAEGLSEADARRPMTPSATSILGVIKHLAAVERGYFCDAFGRAREALPWEDDELWFGGDMWPRPEETAAFILSAYRDSWSMADAVISELDLDAPGRHWSGKPITLGWMLMNVLVDTARHAGHADIVRELIDGATGMGPTSGNTPDPRDDEYWEMYRRRVAGALSKEEWMAFAKARLG